MSNRSKNLLAAAAIAGIAAIASAPRLAPSPAPPQVMAEAPTLTAVSLNP